MRFVTYPFVHGSFTHVLMVIVFLLGAGQDGRRGVWNACGPAGVFPFGYRRRTCLWRCYWTTHSRSSAAIPQFTG